MSKPTSPPYFALTQRSSRVHDPRVSIPARMTVAHRWLVTECSGRCEVDVRLPPTPPIRLSHPHNAAPRLLRVTPHNLRIAHAALLPHGRHHTAAHARTAIPPALHALLAAHFHAAIILSRPPSITLSRPHRSRRSPACSIIRTLRCRLRPLSARSTRARASFRVHACTTHPDSMNPPLPPPPARYTHAGATRLFLPRNARGF
ncbi:hypothetical protein B0H13DRAFT_2560347 [Mycena leptocephala]|nr:hypothetical protein B0H13DRAFT_2560347 [Mycena leptocephala]